MRLVGVDAVDVGATGPAGDRAFHLRERREGRAHDAPPEARPDRPGLGPPSRACSTFTFPDGTRVAAPVEPGAAVTTAFYDGRPVPGQVVEGPFAAAISEHIGAPVDLVARAGDGGRRGRLPGDADVPRVARRPRAAPSATTPSTAAASA